MNEEQEVSLTIEGLTGTTQASAARIAAVVVLACVASGVRTLRDAVMRVELALKATDVDVELSMAGETGITVTACCDDMSASHAATVFANAMPGHKTLSVEEACSLLRTAWRHVAQHRRNCRERWSVVDGAGETLWTLTKAASTELEEARAPWIALAPDDDAQSTKWRVRSLSGRTDDPGERRFRVNFDDLTCVAESSTEGAAQVVQRLDEPRYHLVRTCTLELSDVIQLAREVSRRNTPALVLKEAASAMDGLRVVWEVTHGASQWIPLPLEVAVALERAAWMAVVDKAPEVEVAGLDETTLRVDSVTTLEHQQHGSEHQVRKAWLVSAGATAALEVRRRDDEEAAPPNLLLAHARQFNLHAMLQRYLVVAESATTATDDGHMAIITEALKASTPGAFRIFIPASDGGGRDIKTRAVMDALLSTWHVPEEVLHAAEISTDPHRFGRMVAKGGSVPTLSPWSTAAVVYELAAAAHGGLILYEGTWWDLHHASGTLVQPSMGRCIWLMMVDGDEAAFVPFAVRKQLSLPCCCLIVKGTPVRLQPATLTRSELPLEFVCTSTSEDVPLLVVDHGFESARFAAAVHALTDVCDALDRQEQPSQKVLAALDKYPAVYTFLGVPTNTIAALAKNTMMVRHAQEVEDRSVEMGRGSPPIAAAGVSEDSPSLHRRSSSRRLLFTPGVLVATSSTATLPHHASKSAPPETVDTTSNPSDDDPQSEALRGHARNFFRRLHPSLDVRVMPHVVRRPVVITPAKYRFPLAAEEES